MKMLGRLILVLVGLAVFAVIVAVAALFLMPRDKMIALAQDQFYEATGRELTITGDVRPSIYPVLGLKTGAFTLANAEWSDKGPMVSAEGLAIGLRFVPALAGRIEVTELQINQPQILLERNADGLGNWEIVPSGAIADESPDANVVNDKPLGDVVLPLGEIEGANFRFIDHGAGTDFTVEDLNLTMRLPKDAERASVQGDALVNEERVRIEADVIDPNGLLSGGVRKLALAVNIGDVAVAYTGALGLEPVSVDGDLMLDAPSLGPVFALAALEPVDLPAPFHRNLGIDAKIAFSAEAMRVDLTEATLKFGGNSVATTASLNLAGGRPALKAALMADRLDLSGLTAGGGTGGGTQTSGWSKDRIDVSALGLLDADITLQTGAMDVGVAEFDRADLALTIEDRRAVLGLRQVVAYGGALSGQIIANGRNGLSARVDLRGDEVKMQPLLIKFADMDRLKGATDFDIDVLGVGNSMDALMRSLDGSVSLSIGKGELLGLDLVGMLKNLDASYRGEGSKTVFNNITATGTIKGGVLTNNDLLFDAPLAKATGEGTVDIGAQTVDYRVIPTALTGDETGISVPVIITGPWSNLTYRPDLEGLVNQNLEEEAKKLEEAAKTAVQKKIEEATGVEGETDPAKALEQKLQDEIKKGLGGLLPQ